MKARWWITFISVICLGIFITLAVQELITPKTLTTKEMTTQVERVYSGSVQSLIKKSDYYVASFDKDGSIYEVSLNPLTGQFSNLHLIFKNEAIVTKENLETNYSSNNKTQPFLTEHQAIEIALKEIPGEIDSIDYEKTADGGIYEIEVEQGKNEITIQIHAITGKILSIQYDD